ncbi:tyrosine--tRNA ligase [Hyphobacterium sp. HN65]|uniref:Tyrosine--tRNA ligase n=1 Tax=Hyphobacterium lacteum TaxID=3116575 RepID=A0ABU7LLM1_9PROT|nr:tyrosine--tRNA ligase [Hyphobacterium sp. HN65]MEE2524824.1 tyrosine--tRNA ligase [Hyphobacterium sp. HN65]
MTEYKSELIQTLVSRGYLNQATDIDALDEAAAKGPITGYIGFDITASSLHVGSLVQIMMLRRMQQTGHRPIILIGGGTTKIGDPSGKDQSRQMMTEERIQENLAGILKPFGKLMTIGDGPTDAIVVNNDEWLSKFGYLEFLRTYGPHFTINRMMTFESVKLRLEREQPLTFLEFNYMLLQAVDFLELSRRYDCTLQLGGGDQWGNIINGVELCRRIDQKPVFGFTTPLITTASGAKMGKTADGAVWLNDDLLSPYEYWQFWRNTEDADVGKFLRLFTDVPLDEIAALEQREGAELNDVKVRLANEATAMMHGAEAAKAAEETARATFAAGGSGGALPSFDIPSAELASGFPVLGLLTGAGFAESNGEAKRLIKGGGVRVNGEVVSDTQAVVTADDLDGGAIKISAGKKRHALGKPA